MFIPVEPTDLYKPSIHNKQQKSQVTLMTAASLITHYYMSLALRTYSTTLFEVEHFKPSVVHHFYNNDGNNNNNNNDNAPVLCLVKFKFHPISTSSLFYKWDFSTFFLFALSRAFVCQAASSKSYSAGNVFPCNGARDKDFPATSGSFCPQGEALFSPRAPVWVRKQFAR